MGSASETGLTVSNLSYTQGISLGTEGLDAASKIYVAAKKSGIIVAGGKDAIDSFVPSIAEDSVRVESNDIYYEKYEEPVIQKHIHCICGLKVSSSGQTNPDIASAAAHICSEIEWKPWTETDRLPNYSDCETVGIANYWYLTSDVVLAARWTPGLGVDGTARSMNGTKIILCLNGKQVSCTDIVAISAYLGTINGVKYNYNVADVDLTITDCTDSGMILANPAKNQKISGAVLTSGADRTSFTLYGGTISANGSSVVGSTKPLGGGVIYLNKANNSFTLYGGRITGGAGVASSGAFSGGNVYVGGTATIYGGQIDGGSITVPSGKAYAARGGNLYADTVNQYGGTVTGGSITNSGTGESAGSNVYAVTAYNLYGGTGSVD
jgi:hypothetical protein